uniref:aggregation-promoting factor C-terminal-like domain-containing protein n=1 Tax=Herbidospora sakaeratensis TaxID=564415 RepID=UPI000ABC0AB2|nr:lytic transglycosylase domain-containing protein [Herbidospora sakaeratensis]
MFTPKRLVITGVTVALIAGFTTFLVRTAIDNANQPKTPIDILGFNPDIIGNDPRIDALKADAASAMQEEKLASGREGRKPFGPDDSVEIPKEAPGGGGFLPADFPPGSSPDPGSNKALGKQMNAAMGWEGEWGCLEKLWDKESHWNERAMNRYSGAYGIPQSLPGSKMASAGSDWQTNPATQIKWGLGYIKGRYGSPCGAWGHSQRVGWY